MIYICNINTPLGIICAAAENNALVGLWFNKQKYYPEGIEKWIEKADYAIFENLREWLREYFSGKKPTTFISLNPQGTAFQKSVWEILQTIPYGETLTYGEIAEKINKKTAFQAVGGAVGRNPISIIIPCHRVVGFNRSLTGYAGGLEKKRALLNLEGVRNFSLTMV